MNYIVDKDGFITGEEPHPMYRPVEVVVRELAELEDKCNKLQGISGMSLDDIIKKFEAGWTLRR